MKNRFKALSDTATTALQLETIVRYVGETFEIVESIYKGKTYYYILTPELKEQNLNRGVKTWICYVGEYEWLMKAVNDYKHTKFLKDNVIWNSLHRYNPKYHV